MSAGVSTGDRPAPEVGARATWNILYRGSLSSCNYGCDYCPFAKTRNTRAELAVDAEQLARFERWVTERTQQRIGILFTPWGEALIRQPYRDAMSRLSHQRHVYRVAIQTNLSCDLEWLDTVDKTALALWTTFHPTQTSRQRFVERCAHLDSLGIQYSVGTVGLKQHFHEIEALRAELAPHVYVWINAYKREPGYYAAGDLDRLRAIDPYFDLNRHYYASFGKPCNAGHTSFAVAGDGEVRRCHFTAESLGNLYTEDIALRLSQTDCTETRCGCHIGYVHRPELGLYELFGDGVLNRIPAEWPKRRLTLLT